LGVSKLHYLTKLNVSPYVWYGGGGGGGGEREEEERGERRTGEMEREREREIDGIIGEEIIGNI